MVMPATTLLSTTLYPIVATSAIVEVTKAVWPKPTTKAARSVGATHYHYRGNKSVISHKHAGGHESHVHRGLPGYGRTRKSLRK